MNRLRSAWRSFFDWYGRHYTAGLVISTLLFATQLVHLYWLTAHVVAFRLLGESYWSLSEFWQTAVSVVDYFEIPALVSTTILYLYLLRRRFDWRKVALLIGINLQWLHIAWISDEFVLSSFGLGEAGTAWPVWLAWIAILIDYLELPAIYDTTRRTINRLRRRV